ncbi:MAG: gamma-D-glutamyl-meso-diaminopimelate peptidase [Oscillospiraceae bacterium]|nr:gamma-D-glutamyl-meso-diaminopimelate peptidase [Oscillospiraceae bacterium]
MNIKHFLETPPSYIALKKILSNLNKKYNFIKLYSIGKTWLNKDIFSISIGNINDATIFVGAVHSQEWLTTLLLIKLIDKICLSINYNLKLYNLDIKEEFKIKGIIFVPMLNPDGVEIGINGASAGKKFSNHISNIISSSNEKWQANARGVDLNHNFDAGFSILKKIEQQAGIIKPSPTQYGGVFPNSEKESKAIVDFILYNQNKINKLIAFHSQGEEIFYKYGNTINSKGKFLANIISKNSRYKLIENSGLASHGGLKDWFLQKIKKPALTIEIGKGENPLPITQLDEIYNKLAYSLILSIFL